MPTFDEAALNIFCKTDSEPNKQPYHRHIAGLIGQRKYLCLGIKAHGINRKGNADNPDTQIHRLTHCGYERVIPNICCLISAHLRLRQHSTGDITKNPGEQQDAKGCSEPGVATGHYIDLIHGAFKAYQCLAHGL